MSERSKPKMIVFDLDYTLWPFWVDTHVTPPFHKNSNGAIKDATGRTIDCYPEVPQVLEKLHNEGYILAAASRTSEIQGAYKLLDLFGWKKYFSYTEIYPGSKVQHFNKFKKKSGMDFRDMLFFDDEDRNIVDLRKQGVASILVRNGAGFKVIESGLREYANVNR